MTGVLGFIVGYGEGGETEDFGDETIVSLSAGAVETVGVPAVTAIGWGFTQIPGVSVQLPAFAQASFGFEPMSIGIGLLGLFASGTVGGFLGVQTRQLTSWTREAFGNSNGY